MFIANSEVCVSERQLMMIFLAGYCREEGKGASSEFIAVVGDSSSKQQ